MVQVHRTTLRVPAPFELPLVLRGHGWVALAPHRHDQERSELDTPLRLGEEVVRARVRGGGRGLAIELQAARRLQPTEVTTLRAQLAHMLRVDDDLSAFWALCAAEPRLHWVPRRGAGRLLRSAGVFEDLMKLLLTTNCTWSLTEAMVRNLVEVCGPVGPDGERAFPTAAECDRGERFFRDRVRVGYRARAAAALARAFARGALHDAHFTDPGLPTAELRARVLALDGFGPYAAGQAMRLLGRYDDLALDSWCRATLARLLGKKRPPSDAAIARRYRAFGEHAGLALWCELTAPWHGEGPAGTDPDW